MKYKKEEGGAPKERCSCLRTCHKREEEQDAGAPHCEVSSGCGGGAERDSPSPPARGVGDVKGVKQENREEEEVMCKREVGLEVKVSASSPLSPTGLLHSTSPPTSLLPPRLHVSSSGPSPSRHLDADEEQHIDVV